MSRKTESPAIPEGGEGAVQAIKEGLEIGLGRRGNKLEKFVTFRDLTDAGFGVNVSGGGVSLRGLGDGSGGGIDPATGRPVPGGPIDIGADDLTKPPRPQNVRARGVSMSSIGVSWDDPQYNNHRYAEIFASKSDNWAHILTTFDATKPVSRGNRTPFFMGTANGSMFLHRNLQDTVPKVDVEFPLTGITVDSGTTTLFTSGTFAVGDTVYLSGPQGWMSAGTFGDVVSVQSDRIVIDAEAPGTDVPAGATLIRQMNQDDLEAALSPQTIYYWVRFVSQANVVGDPQSEAGVPGRVFIDPERVLDILTGRIRTSNLAGELLAPIEFVRGPLVPRLETTESTLEDISVIQVAFGGNDDWDAFASKLTELRMDATDALATAEQVNALEAVIGGDSESGVSALARALDQRFVKASDDEALAWMADQLTVKYNQNQWLTNEVKQEISANADAINNSITLRVQQDNNGVLTTAGFGIGLQSSPSNPGQLTSTFAVSADQFAIMGAGNQGRRVVAISNSPSAHYRIDFSSGSGDLLTVGTDVALAMPPNAPSNISTAFRGKTYRVMNRGTNVVHVRLVDSEGSTSTSRPISISASGLEGYAMFPAQNIPFIVDTGTGTVGIRGKLIVDGMINTQRAEITELLDANDIWSETITNFGLAQSAQLLGEAIGTPRISGWSVRMAVADFSKLENRVLEFGRWGHSNDGINPEAISSYPNLDPSRPSDDTVFFVGTRGSGSSLRGWSYMRGSVLIDGQSRIANITDNTGHFTQMDSEFPLLVMSNQLSQSWMNTPAWDQWNYGSGPSRRNFIRQNAFFWIDKGGQAGFNAPTGAIYLNDNPLELPASGGNIRVIRRLASQQGRVFASATFEVVSNRFDTRDRLGIWYELFLIPTNLNYQTLGTSAGSFNIDYRTWTPGQRSAMGGVFGGFREPAAFMNNHFLIVRATNFGTLTDSGSVRSSTPGQIAFDHWRNQQLAAGARSIARFYCTQPTPGSRTLTGSVVAPSGVNYKALVVAAEINGQGTNTSATYLYGAVDSQDTGSGGLQHRGGINIIGGHIHSQQTSDRDGT